MSFQLHHLRRVQPHPHQPRQGPPPAQHTWPLEVSQRRPSPAFRKSTHRWTQHRQGAPLQFHQWISPDHLLQPHQQHQWSLNPWRVKWPTVWTRSSKINSHHTSTPDSKSNFGRGAYNRELNRVLMSERPINKKQNVYDYDVTI